MKKRIVQSGHYTKNRKPNRHPVIRLAGKHLEKAGFHIGDTVYVAMADGIIMVTKA